MSMTVLTENEFAQVKEAVFAYLSRHQSTTNRELRALTNIGYD